MVTEGVLLAHKRHAIPVSLRIPFLDKDDALFSAGDHMQLYDNIYDTYPPYLVMRLFL